MSGQMPPYISVVRMGKQDPLRKLIESDAEFAWGIRQDTEHWYNRLNLKRWRAKIAAIKSWHTEGAGYKGPTLSELSREADARSGR